VTDIKYTDLNFLRQEMVRASVQLSNITVEPEPDYITVCDICGTKLKRNIMGYCTPCTELLDKGGSPYKNNKEFREVENTIYIKNAREETGYHFRGL